MHRSFRFEPPEPRPDVLARPRLLRALQGRWRHRATVVVGGPGLGKTTLLAQTLTENRLAPRGHDVWVGVEAHDAEGDLLARAVATAISRPRGPAPGSGTRTGSDDLDVAELAADVTTGPGEGAVADAVWRRSPAEVCLVFDDVHLLPEGSTGARWLARLLDILPANGHVVLTSRSDPPVPLARLRSQGAVLDVAEADLLFTDAEVGELAAQRRIDAARFTETGGWPVLVELAAHLDRQLTGAYLWEEVLEPVGPERRHVLAVLCDLGTADGELVSAVLDTPVDLAAALRGIPFVAHDAEGWYVPHALWNTAPGIELEPAERDAVRQRAVVHLTERGRVDEAFNLVREAGMWDLAPQVLRAGCLASDRLTSSRLDRWLSQSPPEVRASPAGRLAVGVRNAFTAPADASELLRQAAKECRAIGDVDAELIAIAELGKVAWWRQDPQTLDAKLVFRVGMLGAEGNPVARGLAALGTALFADLAGNDDMVLAALESLEPGSLPDRSWEALAGWLEGVVRVSLGDTGSAQAIVERLGPGADRVSRDVVDVLRLMTAWARGKVDQVVDEMPAVMASGLAEGVAAHSYVGLCAAGAMYSYIGDVGAAHRCLELVAPVVPPSSGDEPPVMLALVQAALRLAEGDEPGATTLVRDVLQGHGLDEGVDRRAWRQTLPLSYVLVPETRSHWDAAPLQGHLQVSRQLAQMVVACRTAQAREQLADAELPDHDLVRTLLHHRLAAELAVGLHLAGRSQGAALLDALGPVGRGAVRALTTTRTRQSKPARALLASLPAPPPRTTYLSALGPLTLHRDSRHGDEVNDPDLRRRRVRELLAYLVGHRSTTRSALMAALWPDLEPDLSSNNLAVTLSYLLRVLEPWRASGEPAYLVRLDGQSVRLVTDGHLSVDLDDFDRHVTAATEAESDGTPSVALGHHLAAAALYRGELFADLPETNWITLDREHYATRYVSASSRAAQLLLGRGDVEQAENVARQAVDADPWAEAAHGVLVGAALSRNDRAAAQRRLERCLSNLADLGVEPSEATRQLHRRVQLGEPEVASTSVTAPDRVRRPDRPGAVS